MNTIRSCSYGLLCLVIFLFALKLHAQEDFNDSRVQHQSPPPRLPPQPWPQGITARMNEDWARGFLAPVHGPDRSFRSIWVRLFPLVSVPLSDPYPQTVNIYEIDLQNPQNLDVYDLQTGALLGSVTNLHLDFNQPTFGLGASAIPLTPLWIVPHGTTNTQLLWDKGSKMPDGRSATVGLEVRGGFVMQKTTFDQDAIGKPKFLAQDLWSVTNVVDVEHYLLAVVPSEAEPHWKSATYAAQAIAARTFGLHEAALARDAGKLWDIDPSTWYQSYRGARFLDRNGHWLPVEQTFTSQAVVATAGQVVTYKGELIEAYFSGNSGGKTCTVNECFGLPDLPYIQQVVDAPGILHAPGGTWGSSANLTAKSIETVLIANGLKPTSSVVRLAPLKQGPSGRTWQLSVLLEKGQIDLDPLQTRKIMHLYGPIRSFLYTLGKVDKKGKQAIVGHGYGHGVGMSQFGAELYARKGWTAKRILQHYYPGTEIKVLFH